MLWRSLASNRSPRNADIVNNLVIAARYVNIVVYRLSDSEQTRVGFQPWTTMITASLSVQKESFRWCFTTKGQELSKSAVIRPAIKKAASGNRKVPSILHVQIRFEEWILPLFYSLVTKSFIFRRSMVGLRTYHFLSRRAVTGTPPSRLGLPPEFWMISRTLQPCKHQLVGKWNASIIFHQRSGGE